MSVDIVDTSKKGAKNFAASEKTTTFAETKPLSKSMKKIFCIAAMAAMMLCNSMKAQVFNDGLRRSTPEAQGVKSEAIAEAFKKLKDKEYDVHGLMILRHGQVIAEHWWSPYAAEYPHAMYSATKTFTGLAVGFAVEEKLLKVSDKVIKFFPELLPKEMPQYLDELTVEHLLTMSCGHASTRYAGSGAEQMKNFLATPFSSKPGTVFAYDVTCSHVLSHIINRVTGMNIKEYLTPRLFIKLGIEPPVWEMDLDGVDMGNGGSHMRTSDLAKLGQLLLNQGMWKGEQIINKEWVKAQTTPHIYQRPELSAEENMKDDGGQGYGYQTWMGRHGSYRAIGGCNQLAMVIPEYDLVVASTGYVRDEAGFNQVFYDMLDGMSNKALKPTKGFDLEDEICIYNYPAPYASAGYDWALKGCTKVYSMLENELGLNSVSLRFDRSGNCTVTLETSTAIYNHQFGLASWEMGRTDRRLPQTFSYPNPMEASNVQTAGYCAWTAENTLSTTLISMYNVNSVETAEYKLEGNQLVMTINGKVLKGISL